MDNRCKFCGGCCKHIAIEIDMPDDRDDYEDIYWYLLHENIKVFVTDNEDEDSDDEESWFVEFHTKCKQLDEQNLCRLHNSNKKPKICNSYDADECVNTEGESEEIFTFNTADEFLEYLRTEKGIDLKSD